jgi:DNA-binding HxlR family transcriptional regulator
MKTRQDSLRSDCPINYSLELIGDSWSLLIIRDMVYFGKKTYGEFMDSDEGIARNILASRLVQLIDNGIITKTPHPDGRKDIYKLTEKGLGLIPILLDMADWGAMHSNQYEDLRDWLELVRLDRSNMIALITEAVRAGDAIFAGENSVVSKPAR